MSPVRHVVASLVAPPGAVRVTSPRGSFAYWELTPGVFLTEVRGFMTREMARLIIERAEPLFERQPRVHGFHNWLAMENYESACRVDLTAWVLRRHAQVTNQIAFTSRIVAMGVAVANLALGNVLRVHADETSLTAALRETLASER